MAPLGLGGGMNAFQVGQSLGTGQSTLGAFVTQLTERMKSYDALRMKSEFETAGKIREAQIVEPIKAQAQVSAMRGVLGDDGTGGSGDAFLEGWSPSGPTLGFRSALREKERIKGMPAESAGKKAAIDTSLSGLHDVERMLFPTGQPESQRTDLLRRMAIPFGMQGSTEAQQIDSRIKDAIATKLRLETGAAARPEEIQSVADRFRPLARLTPAANLDRLRRLQQVLQTGQSTIDPTGVFRSTGAGEDLSLLSDDELREMASGGG